MPNVTDTDVARWVADLDQLGDRLDRVTREHADAVDRIRGDDSRSDSFKADQLDRARQDADARLTETERLARNTIDTLARHGASAVPDPDSSAALLREQRETRAWSRAQAQLGQGMPWQRVAADADRDSDVATLAALRAEAPVIAGTDDGQTAVRWRADVGLARAGGEQASRARARVLSGPLADRLDAQTGRARMHVGAGSAPNRPGQPGDAIGQAVAGRGTAGRVDALRAALDAGSGAPVPGVDATTSV